MQHSKNAIQSNDQHGRSKCNVFKDSENFIDFNQLYGPRTPSEEFYGYDNIEFFKLVWTTDGTETPDWEMPSERIMTWYQNGDIFAGHDTNQPEYVKLEGLSWPWAPTFNGLHASKNGEPTLFDGIEGGHWFYSVGYRTAWNGGQPGYTMTGESESSLIASKTQLFRCGADTGTYNLFYQ